MENIFLAKSQLFFILKTMNKIPVIVIVGQTASGKSDLAVKLAKEFDGEVISADSRQVYKEFNLTSGKITQQEMQGVPHYLLDVLSAKTRLFNAYDFKKYAEKAIIKIWKKGKLPIIAGGTGFYIDALMGEVELSSVPENKLLRKKLSAKSNEELLEILRKKDPQKAKSIDAKNTRKVIRAIEIAYGKTTKKLAANMRYDPLWIGIKWEKDVLRSRIKKRLKERLKNNMCDEVALAHRRGVSLTRLLSLGLEMKYCTLFIQNKLTRTELETELENKIWQYAKRQATYWRRNKKIKWFQADEYNKIKRYVKLSFGDKYCKMR